MLSDKSIASKVGNVTEAMPKKEDLKDVAKDVAKDVIDESIGKTLS